MAQKILVVEDMEPVVDILRTILEREGFEVSVAADGPEGLEAAHKDKPDLMILDLVLPGLDGLEVLRRIRNEPDTAQLPVLILSGKEEEQDKVIGLEVGADDYVTKPFNAKELIARVKTHLRRATPAAPPRMLRTGDITMDLDRYTVTLGDRAVHVTSKEFDLLRALLLANGRVLSRDVLYETVWGVHKDADVESRTIDVHIRSLRSKLEHEGRRILTVRNVGYRLDPT